jgi:protein O-GlcNAc transferase
VSIDSLRGDARHALQAAEFSKAVGLLKQCVQLEPDDSESWFMLGAAFDRLGDPEQALHAFSNVERLQPALPHAVNAQAAMLSLLDRWEDALAAFQRALALSPDDAQILTNIGIAHEKRGRDDEAMRFFDMALARDGNHLGAYNSRGALLLKRGQPEAALDDHRRFVTLAPNNPMGHYNCAESLAALLRDQEALSACDAALKLDARHVKAHVVRGVMLAGMGRFAEAGAALQTAAGLNPALFAETFKNAGFDIDGSSVTNPEYIYCLRGKQRLQQCDWSGYDEFVATFSRLVSTTPEGAQEIPDYSAVIHISMALPLSPEVQYQLARNVAAKVTGKSGALARLPRRKDNRIRIGYVSPEFRSHATAHLTCRQYALHDRRKFEVYAYSLQPDDGSILRRQIIAGCDVFRECSEWSTREIVERVRQDDIDILVDLSGHTDFTRPEIFAWRPARINVNHMGTNGTSGGHYMDYRITDAIASPPGQEQFYTEKMIRLAGSCMTYNDQFMASDPGTRADHGLPEKAFVFCCFNNAYKIEPKVFTIWMDVLRDVPDSVLWIYLPSSAVKANLEREAVRRGVAADRLIFAPRLPLAAHVGRYRLADLFLDTFYCNSQTTSLDALWAGLPVLTCTGETFSARVCTSHLTLLGLPELIADSADRYGQRARALAGDTKQLSAIRTKLLAARSSAPLFRSETIVRELERACLEMWRRYQAGHEPAAFDLK